MVTFWFITIAILWTGFLVLEGFDFGVGALHTVVGGDENGGARSCTRSRPCGTATRSGSIVAAAAMFAAFPAGTRRGSRPSTGRWCCC